MSAFSFTAPVVSPEDEKAEFDGFTAEEQQAIRDDMRGHENSYLRDGPEDDEVSQALFDEALKDLADSDKTDYLDAVRTVPSLVERETPSGRFLKATKYDARAAAQKMVQYWKLRRDFFGDRAWRPMTSTEDGILSPDERRVLELGYLAVLPPDDRGRPVFYINRVRTTKAVAPRMDFVRLLFYTVHVLSLLPESQHYGAVTLVNMRGFGLAQFDRIFSKRLYQLSVLAMPIDIKAVHVMTGSGRSVTGLVFPVLKQIFGQHVRHRLMLHSGSNSEVVASLSVYNITPRSIPFLVGGTWDQNQTDFQEWLEQQRTKEREFIASLQLT